MSNVSVTYPRHGERQCIRHISDEVVFEEALENTRLTGLYWSATGAIQREYFMTGLPGLNNLKLPLHSFELQIDGQSLHNRWEWAGGTTRESARHPGVLEFVLELRHQVRPVGLKVVTRLDGTRVLVRYLEITNTGDRPAALNQITPWCGLLWNTKTAGVHHPNCSFDERRKSKFTLGYLAGEEINAEGDFRWQPLTRETFAIERTFKGSSYATPYYILRNEVTGESAFLGLAWSANFTAKFMTRHEDLLFFSLSPLTTAPMRMIEPGETVTSPEVHLGLMNGSLDAGVQAWHAHMRKSVVPPRPKGKEMFTLAGHIVDEPGDWILKEIDIAADMGAECYVVDAGWYGRSFSEWPALRGDWQVGDWLPGGNLDRVREHVKAKGMLFGLWQDAEAMTHKTDTFKAHPDWLLRTDGERGVDNWGMLDLANPEAAKHYEETILRLIREQKLDFYKLDYNLEAYEGGVHERHGYLENEYWRHFEVVYRAYDRVLREFPDVVTENCAGGGGRNDLGMMSRFHFCSASDLGIFPQCLRILNAMTLFIPPESIAYYHNLLSFMHHLRGDLDTQLRVALFAVPVFVEFGRHAADHSPVAMAKIKKYIELHKGFCRPVLAGHPVVHHHTPDIGLTQLADWCVLEYALPDRSRGYAGIWALSGAGEYVFRARGVDVGATYEVTIEGRGQPYRLAGTELAQTGLRFTFDTPLTSELVLYRRLA